MKRPFAFALAGTLATFAGSPALATPAAQAVVSPAPASAEQMRAMLQTVPRDDAAYPALRTLQADGFLSSYARGAFDARQLTRYEVAVAAQKAAQQMQSRLAEPDASTTVQQADVDALRALVDKFGSDIDELRKEVEALQSAMKTTNDTVEHQQEQLDRTHIGIQYFLRAPGVFNDHVTAYNGNSNVGTAGNVTYKPNQLLPQGTPLVVGNNPGQIGQNALQAGDYSHGTGYQVLRMILSGSVDPQFSYLLRLENKYYFDNAVGQSTTTPTYCTSTSCSSSGDYPSNATLRLNIAAVSYKFKNSGGVYATAGRFLETEGPLGLDFEDYFNGAEVGIRNSRIRAVAGYGFGNSSLSNSGGSTYTTGQQFFATGQYQFNPRWNAGASFLADLNYAGQVYWDPNMPLTDPVNGFPIKDVNGNTMYGGYKAANANMSFGTVFVTYNPVPRAQLEFEGLHRFGNDPFTGSHWTDADAFWFLGQYGDYKAKTNGNYAELGLVEAGLNSTGPQTKLVGTPTYQQFYVNDPNGYRIGYVGVQHWLNQYARVGLEYQIYNLMPNLVMPAGSSACPGCVVTQDRKNALLLETYLNF